MVPTVAVSAVQVLALAALGVAAGNWLRARVSWLTALNIPGSVVGGFLLAGIVLASRDRVANFQPDTVLQSILMTAFFTTVGLSASVGVIRRGGPQVLLLLGLTVLGAIAQNLVGVGVATALGLHPLTGILAGAVSLAGGPATSLAFGSTFEKMRVPGATTIAVTSAMVGILLANLAGGVAGGWLLRRSRVAAPESGGALAGESVVPARFAPVALLHHVLMVAIAMGAGSLISAAIAGQGIVLPGYIGAMIAAALMRALDDRTGALGLDQGLVDALGVVSLNLFIVMALATLRLWELAGLAGPLLVILAAQVALTVLLLTPLVWVAMRRDEEAAVMAGGYCGYMLGTTANAVACMSALTARTGRPAPRAFIAVPLVGASLLDFANSAVITQMANWFRG